MIFLKITLLFSDQSLVIVRRCQSALRAFFYFEDDSGNAGHNRFPSTQRYSFDAGEVPAFHKPKNFFHALLTQLYIRRVSDILF